MDFTGVDRIDHMRCDIDTDNTVAMGCKQGRGGKADIAQPYH